MIAHALFCGFPAGQAYSARQLTLIPITALTKDEVINTPPTIRNVLFFIVAARVSITNPTTIIGMAMIVNVDKIGRA